MTIYTAAYSSLRVIRIKKFFHVSNSVSKKVFLTYFVSALIIIIVIGLASYQIANHSIVQKVQESSQQTVKQTNEKLDMRLDLVQKLTLQLQMDPALQRDLRLLAKESHSFSYEYFEAKKRIDATLYNAKFTLPMIVSIRILPVSTQSTETWMDKFFRKNGKEVWIDSEEIDLMIKEQNNRFGIGRLWNDIDSYEALGILLVELNGELLKKDLQSIKARESNHVYILNTNGEIIQSSNNGTEDVGDIVHWWSNSPLAKPTAERDGFFVGKNESGDSSLYMYSKSSITGWMLVNQIPLNTLLNDTNHIWWITLLMVLFATLISVGLGMILVRIIAKPLAELSGLMEAGEKGDLSVRAVIRTNDEIGMVGLRFNRMIEKITILMEKSFYTAQLEAQINSEAEHRQIADLLNTSTIEISAAYEVQDIYRLALNHLHPFIEFDRAEVWRWINNEPVIKTSVVDASQNYASEPILSKPYISQLYQEWDSSKRWLYLENSYMDHKPILIIPYMLKANVEGFVVLTPCQAEMPSDSKLEVIFTLITHTSTAVERAKIYDEMRELATRDGLTGILNRRYFFERTEQEIIKCRIDHRPLSLILFDIDHFKKFNDQYGHLAGDHVLQKVALLISSTLRQSDLFARYGGEEFVILLPDCSFEACLQLTEIIRAEIERLEITYNGSRMSVTSSFGLTTYEDGLPLMEFIQRADDALYRAKSAGRNCTSY
ncbi:Phytochrome-like protein cph2 [compost metagenome]